MFVLQQYFQFDQEFVDYVQDVFEVQCLELYYCVEVVVEFWGEVVVDGFYCVGGMVLFGEID